MGFFGIGFIAEENASSIEPVYFDICFKPMSSQDNYAHLTWFDLGFKVIE